MESCEICGAGFPDDTYLDSNGVCGSEVCQNKVLLQEKRSKTVPKCNACGKTIGFRLTENNKNMPVEPGVVKGLTRDGELIDVFIAHWCQEYDDKRKKRGDKNEGSRPQR